MANARLLQAVCTVAMLAAAPAIAQTDTAPASTGAGNSVNAPAADNASTGNGSSGTMSTHPHGSAMAGHSTKMMHGKSSSSQDAAVNQLNDQSYQAAQRGQAFGASNMGSAGMPSGSMNGMPGGSGASAPDTSNTSGK
jgi:hypothetical protein